MAIKNVMIRSLLATTAKMLAGSAWNVVSAAVLRVQDSAATMTSEQKRAAAMSAAREQLTKEQLSLTDSVINALIEMAVQWMKLKG